MREEVREKETLREALGETKMDGGDTGREKQSEERQMSGGGGGEQEV